MDFDPTIETLKAMGNGLLALLPNVAAAVIVVIAVMMLSRALRRTVRQVMRRSGADDYAGIIFGRLAQWATLALGGLVALTIVFPSMDAATLIGVLGLGSLAIGFAFRDIAENFLAGFLILTTRPFRIGDQIDINGFEGTVQDIQARSTSIQTYDGRLVVVPNADFLTQVVIVNTARQIRRSQYDVGIGYPDDIMLAKQLILEELAGIEGVLKEPPPDVLTVELSDSSVNLRVRWWSSSARSEVVATTDRVITAVKLALDRGGVNIPFPIRTIHFDESLSANIARAASSAD